MYNLLFIRYWSKLYNLVFKYRRAFVKTHEFTQHRTQHSIVFICFRFY